MTAKKPRPSHAPTPEQAWRNALLREAILSDREASAALAARALSEAIVLAEEAVGIRPRVVARYLPSDGFSAVFGEGPLLPGRGLVCLSIEPRGAPRDALTAAADESRALPAPTLRVLPRSYSLGSDAVVDDAAALGLALTEAAIFARALLARLARCGW